MSDNSLKILEIVSDFLQENPDQRFCQSLSNLGILKQSELLWLVFDPYYTDDEVVIERIKKTTRII